MNSLANNIPEIEDNSVTFSDEFFKCKIGKNGETVNFSDNATRYFNCTLFIFILFVLFFTIPICFCDLYYAYTDESCVLSHVDKIDINLKQYLQVSGLLIGCSIFIFIFNLILIVNNYKGLLILLYIFIKLLNIFSLVWHIIGGFIFWKYMDNSLCSNSVFNYVYVSLIIKYIFTAISSFSINNKK